jgi:tetratricopeptide (TPR) repeat protein
MGPLARAWPLAVMLGAALAAGCHTGRKGQGTRVAADKASAAPVTAAGSAAAHAAAEPEPTPRPLRRCFPDLPTWVDSPMALLLDRAGEYLDKSDPDGALACAEEAARQAPGSVEAHHDRAVALMRLGRLDEARDALTLALAIAPTDPETLELAADFYVNHLPPSAERAAVGLEYARRGARHTGARDRDRAAHLALLEGQALIDLGRSGEALRPLTRALKLTPDDESARYERGVALFELCRFAEARQAFERVLELEPGHAHAQYHLGLILERQGDDAGARVRFAAATHGDPKSFPAPLDVSATEFAARVQRVLTGLATDLRADLKAISVETAELPATEDLTAELPPLSPTILGLFRGLPLGRDDAMLASTSAARGGRSTKPRVASSGATANPATYLAPERAIILYRRNILRSVQSTADLDHAIERTLLHEAGHLRGEDDGSLRDRGLE